ncbi:hypothetical protein FY134_03080 [Agrobacterium fabrum]|uniref:DUF5681 domain-containing protein n=1 Tax=Agrobacterium fabrum TaxID=1176649 RepID=UPI0021CE4A75|nr:DUF5681 domain-containing protein [Agrobacterium fabrum]UXT56682.1 hypothetical protein FY134_03080 [Agrobacterium fabrum]
MTRKYKKVPPEQKLIDGNTPMTTSPSGRKYPMTDKQIEGRKRGGFQKGKSGNPKGRPRVPDDVKAALLGHSLEAVAVAYDLMMNSQNDMVRLKATDKFTDPFVSKAASKHDHDVVVVTHSDLMTRLAKARELPLELTDYEVIEQDKQP